ncbi:MAG: potassium-transporting ATPase subunit KdpB [Gammaproteobacteria bacterium]|nr:potassium-transporting ATPase subunit KdpB [Gammaproteobacteria bacterium]
MVKKSDPTSFWSFAMISSALIAAFLKLTPRHQCRNPVMFSVYIGAVVALYLLFQAWFGDNTQRGSVSFIFWVNLGLWFTLFFANFSESMAEGRGKAQANSLRQVRHDLMAKKLSSADIKSKQTLIAADKLKMDDLVLVEAGDFIPGDGEVVEGIATVNESAITGESAPVIRESGGDRSSVTGGTQVISDWLLIRITANPGETFMDQMISLVEGAQRQKTPNEMALTILLTAITLVFVMVCASLPVFSKYSVDVMHFGTSIPLIVVIALFVCLVPTTIGGLLSAIGIAGMDRMIQANVIALSGQAVEAAGDVDVLILDKTGTITLGNREAVDFVAADSVEIDDFVAAAQLASLADETPEGRSIVILAKNKHGLRKHDLEKLDATFIPFTAETRMSGANLDGRQIRKGAAQAIETYIQDQGGIFPEDVKEAVKKISSKGGTALVVAEGDKVLGVIHLKDIVKGGIRERFAQLRSMGIKTMMVTGDNPLTAAAISAEAGVDDFLADAKPQDKLKLIRSLQEDGLMVAMAGDGTNDAPALAQSDVAVAMNSGTQAAKEAGNLIDLDSNPTKLIEVVNVGKQLLMTRGALTTFSISNDIAKYFAILPAAFAGTFPVLNEFNLMHLRTPQSAILSAVIFNALILVGLMPLALRGVDYKPMSASSLLRRHMLLYGLGGLIVPFIGIKVIDMLLGA